MNTKDPKLMKRICEYIDQYYLDHHRPPTQREISAAMGISLSSANRYLVVMNENGMIQFNRKVTGSMRMNKCFSDYVSVPIVGSIRCGDPESEDELVDEYVSLPVSVFGKGNYYLLRAQGTSMVDAEIHPGDVLVIEKQSDARVGDIIVALDDCNQNTLKLFAGIDDTTHQAILRYQNEEEYPNEEIRVNELVVQGVLRHIIHTV